MSCRVKLHIICNSPRPFNSRRRSHLPRFIFITGSHQRHKPARVATHQGHLQKLLLPRNAKPQEPNNQRHLHLLSHNTRLLLSLKEDRQCPIRRRVDVEDIQDKPATSQLVDQVVAVTGTPKLVSAIKAGLPLQSL